MNVYDLFYERARILLAYELRIPPDDLDLRSVLQSIFRSIEASYYNQKEEFEITIKNKVEEDAILSNYGHIVIDRFFHNEYPFNGMLERYQDWYIDDVLNQIEEGGI